MDNYVKDALAKQVQYAKEDLDMNTESVQALEKRLEDARKAQAVSQERYNALYGYYRDNA